MSLTKNVARVIQRGWNVLQRTPLFLRTAALALPAVRAYLSLQRLADDDSPAADAARAAQFREWHGEDLQPRLDFYGADGRWRMVPQSDPDTRLWVAARSFFESHGPSEGRRALQECLTSLSEGARLLVYAPHPFAFDVGERFRWVPEWPRLAALAQTVPGVRLLDFNPGFDRNGFFHVVLEKTPLPPRLEAALTGKGRYFYLNVGGNRRLGASALVLSVTGRRALKRVARAVREYSFLARVPEDVRLSAGDIALGHYGPWITGARDCGALTILYGPGDRFRKERHDSEFYARLQTRGNFAAQYRAAHMVIMQAGGRWRMADPWTYDGLCRWIDLPVSSAVFPRTKKCIAPAGQRVFCFVGLYDNYQKGLDIARELCRRCPEFQFIAVGCKSLGAPNCWEYPAIDNRLPRFRRIVGRADFIVSPARDDAQPGTVAECSSLGLLPIISETTGYVLSFPRRMDIEDLDQSAAVLQAAQNADEAEIRGWQILNARYIERFHRPHGVDILMQTYLRQASAAYSEQKL